MLYCDKTSSNTFKVYDILIMIFMNYIYEYTPTYRLTFPSYPTRETKVQIDVA